MKRTSWSAGLSVTGDGVGVVAHAGSIATRLLADRTGLTSHLSAALARRNFVPGHDRGRVLADVAVMLADGGVREGGDVAELTGLLDLTRWPKGMRVIVRRERPHPGAQLSLFEERDGWRYQAFLTNTKTGQLAFLEARHRAHARVEDRIRHAKDSGLGRFPSREFDINQTWLALAMIAADLTAWTRLLTLTGDAQTLANCEPKALRYRLLHVPARLTHSARRRRLRIPESWPWAAAVVAVFANIAAIPQPA